MSILTDLGYSDYTERRPGIPDRGTGSRMGMGSPPQPMETGFSPFGPATAIALWAVDYGTLAPSLFGVPDPSTHFYPVKGTKLQVPLLDHDHGVDKGPPDVVLAIGYLAPGQPNAVTRTDTPGGAVMSAAISYTGAQVASIVITRAGYTITVTPSYTGSDITSVHRVRT